MRTICGALIIFLLLLPIGASATVIHVLADGTGDVPSIGQALAIAVPGDVVSLGPGVYHEHDLVIGPGVQLVSDTDDPATTSIDADGVGRCFVGTAGGVQLVRGITLRNGTHATDGGLVLLTHATRSSARFERCVFRDGSAARGGAVAALDGHSAAFVDCSFVDNTAVQGGAIYTNQFVDVARSEFHGNHATLDGGAVFAQKSFSAPGIWTSESDYTENTAGADGGAIHSAGVGDEYYSGWVDRCRFLGNSAANGGALRVGLHDCVYGSTFLDNSATNRGGAIYLVGVNGGLTEDCDRYDRNLVARNTAAQGGAYALLSSSIFLSFSTFDANGAPDGGHFWMSPGSQVSLYQSIVSFATSGAAASGNHGNSAVAQCTDIFGNAGGDYVGPLAEEATTGHNIQEDPLYCGAQFGDYTLRSGSPCLPPAPAGCYVNYHMGAFGEGCGAVSVETESWGKIKSFYR